MKNENEEFTTHGIYTVSNSMSYEIEVSKSGDMARLRTFDVEEQGHVTEWLPIEFMPDEDPNKDFIAIIDPDGYSIRLDEVMKVNNF